MKIQYDPEEKFSLDVKRCYMPPLVISDECPECGAEVEHDYSQTYFSYPTVNTPRLECFECDEGHEWERWIQLDLTVKAVAAPLEDDESENTSDPRE